MQTQTSTLNTIRHVYKHVNKIKSRAWLQSSRDQYGEHRCRWKSSNAISALLKNTIQQLRSQLDLFVSGQRVRVRQTSLVGTGREGLKFIRVEQHPQVQKRTLVNSCMGSVTSDECREVKSDLGNKFLLFNKTLCLMKYYISPD